MTLLFNMKITSVCCHLSIVLHFGMRILLSFMFVLFYGLLFNYFSVNKVCHDDVTSFHDGCDNDVVNSIILLFFTLELLKYTRV